MTKKKIDLSKIMPPSIPTDIKKEVERMITEGVSLEDVKKIDLDREIRIAEIVEGFNRLVKKALPLEERFDVNEDFDEYITFYNIVLPDNDFDITNYLSNDAFFKL